MHVLRHPQFDTGMPACTIEHQHDLLAGTGPDLACEFGQFHFKDGNADRGRQMKDRAPRGGMDKADEIAPGEAVLYRGNWTLTNRRPDPTEQRLEADAVLVRRPQFDLRLGVGRSACLEQGS